MCDLSPLQSTSAVQIPQFSTFVADVDSKAKIPILPAGPQASFGASQEDETKLGELVEAFSSIQVLPLCLGDSMRRLCCSLRSQRLAPMPTSLESVDNLHSLQLVKDLGLDVGLEELPSTTTPHSLGHRSKNP